MWPGREMNRSGEYIPAICLKFKGSAYHGIACNQIGISRRILQFVILGSQRSQLRHELVYENVPMPGPSSGIGKVDEPATPAGAGSRPLDIFSNRPQHRDYSWRPKRFDRSGEGGFVCQTTRAPRRRIEMIDRIETHVDQIATCGLKYVKKIRVGDGRIEDAK